MKNIINAIVLSFVLTLSIQAFSLNINSDLQNNLIRLHIVANSNSENDQKIKYKIRDEILKNVSLSDKNFLTKAEEIANNELINENYKATAVFDKFYFPKKKYKNITLPQGYYNGIKIFLGEGKGENWWCMLYPPVCVSKNEVEIDRKSNIILKNELNNETYDIITQNNDKIIVKFKVVETYNYIVEKLKNI